jgi:predicted SAM-dependent methyltransferase
MMSKTATSKGTGRRHVRRADSAASVHRLNWGCGDHTAPGWINSDVKQAPGVDLVADILEGLPLEDDSIDYAVSIHALPEIPYPKLVPALVELRRVLKPGGILRLALPDLDKAIRAYVLGHQDHFKVDEREVSSRGGRFIAHMLWYGYSRSLFTHDFVRELLERGGFVNVTTCRYRITTTRFPEIVELDNRADESLFMEAQKPRGSEAELPARHRGHQGRLQGRAGGSSAAARSGQSSGPALSVVRVERAKRAAGLAGFAITQPAAGDVIQGDLLAITGWAVAQRGRVQSIEIRSNGSVVGDAEPDELRRGLKQRFPNLPRADRSGFTVQLRAAGKGPSSLDVVARLPESEVVWLAKIQVTLESAKVVLADPPAAAELGGEMRRLRKNRAEAQKRAASEAERAERAERESRNLRERIEAMEQVVAAAAVPAHPDPNIRERAAGLDLDSASFEQLRAHGLSVSQAARVIGERDQSALFSRRYRLTVRASQAGQGDSEAPRGSLPEGSA